VLEISKAQNTRRGRSTAASTLEIDNHAGLGGLL